MMWIILAADVEKIGIKMHNYERTNSYKHYPSRYAHAFLFQLPT
jgi:hypothetical protein